MLRDASSTSEKTDQRILIMPVSSLGWVRPAAQAQQVRQSRSGLRLCSGSHLFRVRPEKCQGDAAGIWHVGCGKDLFPHKKKRRLTPAFYCVSSPCQGVLGAAGAPAVPLGLGPKSTFGAVSDPAAAS